MDLSLAYSDIRDRRGGKLEYEKQLKEHYSTEQIYLTNEQLEEIKELLLKTMQIIDIEFTWLRIENEFRNKRCCHYNEDRTECKIYLNFEAPFLYQESFYLHYNVVDSIFSIR
jgi:hypothetical protein